MEERKQILEALKCGQNPPLVWLYCSDSRVDYNMFGAQPGDIFSIENAGNVFGLGDESKSTLAYALTHFSVDDHISLLVMGHTNCGAVTAACTHYDNTAELPHKSLVSLVNYISPAVERAKQKTGNLLDNAILENVLIQMQNIKSFAQGLKGIKAGNVAVYGAIYDISGSDDIFPTVWSLDILKQGNFAEDSKIVRIELKGDEERYLSEMTHKVMKISRRIADRKKRSAQSDKHEKFKA